MRYRSRALCRHDTPDTSSRARAQSLDILRPCVCVCTRVRTRRGHYSIRPSCPGGGERELGEKRVGMGGDDGIASGARFDEFAGAVCV